MDDNLNNLYERSKRAYPSSKAAQGFLSAFLAFVAWGILPLYWQHLFYLPPQVITGYRIIFSFLFVLAVLLYRKSFSAVKVILADLESMKLLVMCGLLIGANWGVYMFAIASKNIMQASIGYYINPLMSAVFGVIFYREILSTLQKVSFLLMLIGVVYLVVSSGALPIYSLLLSITFASYGALHKKLKVNVMHGMFFETLTLLVPAFLVVVFSANSPNLFGEPFNKIALLVAGGPLTLLPLLGYAFGVQRLRLITVGIIQYASPTVTFLLGVFYFKEPFSKSLLLVFILIWAGVLLYTVDRAIQTRQWLAK